MCCFRKVATLLCYMLVGVLYLTSTTRIALSASRACSIDLTMSLTRSTPTLTAFIISSAASGVPPAFDSTHNSLCGFKVNVRDPEDTTASKCVGSRIGLRLRLAQNPLHSSPFVICKGDAKRNMMNGQENGSSLIGGMLHSATSSCNSPESLRLL